MSEVKLRPPREKRTQDAGLKARRYNGNPRATLRGLRVDGGKAGHSLRSGDKFLLFGVTGRIEIWDFADMGRGWWCDSTKRNPRGPGAAPGGRGTGLKTRHYTPATRGGVEDSPAGAV